MIKEPPCLRRSKSVLDAETPTIPLPDGAFAEIYRDHIKGVYGLALQLCGPLFAGDVAQDVFATYWQHPERFDPARGSLHSLLLAMTHHRSVDVNRSESSRRARELRQLPEVVPEDHDTRILGDERVALVKSALDQLPADRREAIVTTFYGLCTYKEAAVVLGVPEGTLKSRIRKGMEQMRQALTDVDDLGPRSADQPVADLGVVRVPIDAEITQMHDGGRLLDRSTGNVSPDMRVPRPSWGARSLTPGSDTPSAGPQSQPH